MLIRLCSSRDHSVRSVARQNDPRPSQYQLLPYNPAAAFEARTRRHSILVRYSTPAATSRPMTRAESTAQCVQTKECNLGNWVKSRKIIVYRSRLLGLLTRDDGFDEIEIRDVFIRALFSTNTLRSISLFRGARARHRLSHPAATAAAAI